MVAEVYQVPAPPIREVPLCRTQQPSQPGRSRAWPNKSGQQQPSLPPLQQPSHAGVNAIADVSRLESAIAVLGEDNPHTRPLLDALRVAKTQANVPPIHDRIKACKAYLDRARKRVCRAEAVIARAVEQKTIFDGEVADGEKRLQELLEEVNAPVPVPSPRGSFSNKLMIWLVTGVSSIGKSCATDAACRRRSSPILCDGSADPPNRRQRSMCGGGAFTIGESCVRNARYGLRGVRVGEASNPAPPQTRNRPRVDVAEDIIASLEHDLTHIDSDEPFVQGWF